MDESLMERIVYERRKAANANEKPSKGRPPRARPWKKRACKACTSCRARKVRCDVVPLGNPPCSNCKHDEIECCLPPPRKRRRVKMMPQEIVFSSVEPKYDPGVDCAAGLDFLGAFDAANIQEWKARSLEERNSDEQPMLIDESSMEVEMPTALWNDFLFEEDDRQSHACDLPLPTSPSASPSSLYSASTERSHVSRRPLPGFFKPFHTRIEQYDLEYLQRVDALSVPQQPLRNELLRCYVEFVHDQFPLIDLREFSEVVKNGDQQDKQISLIVFQAVMFAGSAWVDMKMLKKAGFKSREDAEKTLFKRVKLLYDFDCETDQISVIQALLLMTFSKQPVSDGKDWWHWLGLAISLSYRTGLNRDILLTNMSTHKRRLCRRIWWSCFVRDRTLALKERQLARIRLEDCDVPMLCMEDFDLDEGDDPDATARLSVMAERYIEKAILCWCSSNQKISQHADSLRHQPALKSTQAGRDFYLEAIIPSVERIPQSSGTSLTGSTTSEEDWCNNVFPTASSSGDSFTPGDESSTYMIIPADASEEYPDYSMLFKST